MFEKRRRWGNLKEDRGGVNEEGSLNKSRCGGKGWEVKGLIDPERVRGCGVTKPVVMGIGSVGIGIRSVSEGLGSESGRCEVGVAGVK